MTEPETTIVTVTEAAVFDTPEGPGGVRELKMVQTDVEKPVPPGSPKPPADLIAAIQARLIDILKAPLTPRSLLEVEKMAMLARSMLAISSDPMSMQPRGGGWQGMNVIGSNMAAYNTTYSEDGAVLAPAMQTETFGAKALKEIVAAVRELASVRQDLSKPMPIALPAPRGNEDLLYAIAIARERNLDDLVKKLEDKFVKKFLAEGEGEEKGEEREEGERGLVPPPDPGSTSGAGKGEESNGVAHS